MSFLESVEILGGGPGGLYAAVLLRRGLPATRVRVTETGPRDATWGFGVVFSEQALGFLKADDPETHDLISPQMERWSNMTLNHPEDVVVLDGIGFSAIGRLELLQTLQARAESLGVELRYEHRVQDLSEFQADLIIGADGVHSLVREAHTEAFAPRLEMMQNRFAWFGTPRTFETLSQTFIEHESGALNAHHYRYSPEMSTFIVECEANGYVGHGFDQMDEAQTAVYCQDLFREVLQGSPLVTNHSVWRQFPRLWCERWHHANCVLLGDAAHTAHFSIGSGTRLALEDAIVLVRALQSHQELPQALEAYQAERAPIVRKLVNAANTSCEWYQSFSRRMRQRPLDFAYDYVTRSGRISTTRLRKLSPEFAARFEQHRAEQARISDPVGTTAGAQEIEFDRSLHSNCSRILWDNLDRNPEALALVGPAGPWTYAELCAAAAQWGQAFTAFGLQRGDRIALLLDDTPSYPAAFFGAVRCGFVPVLLNPQTPPELLSWFLADTEAPLAVCEAEFVALFAQADTHPNALRQVVVVNGAPEGCGLVGASAFLEGSPTELPEADTTPEDMAFWMYSSGSTGRPKGIIHLHHDMAYTQLSFGKHVLQMQPGDVCFSVPKLFFAYGFGNSVTFPFSVGAASLLMPGRPEPELVLKLIETYRPTIFFGLPTLYTALCSTQGIHTRDLSSLRLCLSAAEILSADVFRAWEAATGLPPVEGLGSTEVLHIYLSNSQAHQELGSAGRPVPGYEIKLLNPEGEEIPEGEEGVLYVRGDSTAPCYWRRPEQTAETMQGDWIYTGDRFVCRNGNYFFQGRADDLVKVSGQWVWPLEVERCLNEHPKVYESAVLAHELPDRRMTLSAVVALHAEFRSGDPLELIRELQDYVKAALLRYKYPRQVHFVEELPKTGTGKLDRQAISQVVEATE